jgi:2-polyprenyl-6-methoxyphenol hydroxylase-like FAD-dependent oxidoreductase
MRRSHNPAETQVYFVMREESAEASAIHRQPVELQQEFWARRFRDAGWQTERFIDGMKTSPFFYSQEVAQVRIGTWSSGRAALAGDAAHCASPYSGMGISGGLVGAYVLAGEINQHPDDLPTALANYETTLRPFVDQIQGEVNPRLLRLGMPVTQRAIDTFQTATALACFLRIPTWSRASRSRTAAATGNSRRAQHRSTPPETDKHRGDRQGSPAGITVPVLDGHATAANAWHAYSRQRGWR